MIGEWLLRKTARPLAEAKKDPCERKAENRHALDTLLANFPEFGRQIKGKTVLDYGCGYGEQVTAMAAAGARKVIGYDPSEDALKIAKAAMKPEDGSIGYIRSLSGFVRFFDVVVSQNAFEHFLDPETDIEKMMYVTDHGGLIFITFGPPWHAPWGAHMEAWCRIPWIQNWPLRWIFLERTVMKVRQTYRTDSTGPKWTYHSVGVGKMTVHRFERLIRKHGAHVIYRRYTCCWGLNFLQHIPIVREWMINHISVVIQKRGWQ